jgi:hypothetical protein
MSPGACQTTLKVTGASPDRSFPKSHETAPAASTEHRSEDACGELAFSVVPATVGGCISNTTCVNEDLPSFENDALYRMIWP